MVLETATTQNWGARVLVSAVSAYGPLLKDELELRLIALEEQLKNSILIQKT